MRTTAATAVFSCILVLLAACSPTPMKSVGTARYDDYVALGDSYSAGPLIGPPVKQQPAGCGRSKANYAGFLATYLQVSALTDVTCSGATTTDLYAAQGRSAGVTTSPARTARPARPQLAAVTARTDLVTIGLGGNDFNLFQSLLTGTGDGTAQLRYADAVRANLEKAIDAIQARAPRARIVVVGYLRVVPANRTCTALSFGVEHANRVDTIERRLNASLASAAHARHAIFVDSYALSTGHDACAGNRAWVNGRAFSLLAAPFHPLRAGMDAVARQIYRQLTAKSPPKAPTDAMLEAVPRR